jgi:hypothetical protein
VFWKKRLQAVENKGKALQKERQEISRGGKSMGAKELRPGECRGRIICRANMPDVIILVYTMSRTILSARIVREGFNAG